jgi:probable F420-dependent oxidoreductase
VQLGRFGIWAGGAWRDRNRRSDAQQAARDLESLGYRALWISAGFRSSLEEIFRPLLEATSTMSILSGIASVWHTSEEEAGASYGRFENDFPGRFVLGLGASHGPHVERSGQRYEHPYSRVLGYLDTLDADGTVPKERRVLAALGPRMLSLAKARTAGAHPYLVPVEHTKAARQVLGDGPLLCTEQAVVLEEDPATARRVARHYLADYLPLPNYANNLRRFGFSDDDLALPGSDEAVDRLVLWGDTRSIVERIGAHIDAGADHVCVQVLTESDRLPRDEYQELAAKLL